MSDTAATESAATGSAQTNSDAVNPAGKDARNVPQQALHIPKPPTEFDDMHRSSRARRVQMLAAQMDEEGEAEARSKILGKDKPVAKAEDEAEEESEPAKPRTAAELADDKKELERKSEERRLALKADADKKLRGAIEAADTGTAPEGTEAGTEQVVDALDAAAAAEEVAPAEKPEDATAKQEKERKAKFERVLKMESESRKRDEKLRAREEGLRRVEADLNAKAKNLDEQYKRLVASNRKDVETAKNVLQMARENPLELLERAGVDPLDVAKWVDRAADPVAQKLKEVDRRFEDLQRREREAADREQKQREESQRVAIRQGIEKQYLEHFEEKEGEDWVFEAARFIFSPQERIRLGDEIAQAAYQREMTFTSRDIAEAVDAEAKEDDRWKTLQKRIAAAKPVEAAAMKPAANPAVAPARVAPRPTVVATNAAAQESAGKPGGAAGAGGRKLSPKEQRELRNRRLFAGLDE